MISTVIDHFAPALKAAGWRRQRFTFNRRLPDDVVQVISFQQGRVPLVGSFTVNLGMTLAPGGDWVSEASCQFRTRIGNLIEEPVDLWWSTDAPDLDALALLLERAEALFDTMRTPTDLVAAAASSRRLAPHYWGRHRMRAAILSLELGDRDAAQRYYAAHFADDDYPIQPSYLAFAAEHNLRVPWFPVSRLGRRLRARRAELAEHRRWDDFDRRNPASAHPQRSLVTRFVRWARA